MIGRMQAGEKLLVLGASGGVGMAAIDIGQALGAEVISPTPSSKSLPTMAMPSIRPRRLAGHRVRVHAGQVGRVSQSWS